jgi:hypothetical protein
LGGASTSAFGDGQTETEAAGVAEHLNQLVAA